MNTHEFYVSLETAKMLKNVGFDWECKKIYFKIGWKGNDDVWEIEDNHKNHRLVLELDYCLLAPTLDVAQRWLREVKGLYVTVDYFSDSWRKHGYPFFEWKIRSEILGPLACITGQRQTYEEALEAGIKKALEIILEK